LSYQNLNGGPQPNQTVTSNFNGSNLSEVEELRKQLAESSVELEETRDINLKRIALQQKQMEEYYEQIALHRNEEKVVRVKVNQMENDLEHHLKRLDIICKSKGLPRPQRKASLLGEKPKAGSYVSPYRRNGPPGVGGSATRNISNNSSAKRPSPGARMGNYSYTPPNKRPGAISQSPVGSLGSQNRFRSPLGVQQKQNTTVTKPKPIV